MRHKKILSKKRVIALVAAGIMIATTLAAPLMAHADTMEYSLADIKKEATDLESQINNFLVEKEAVESLLDVYCAALVDLNKYMDGESKDSENLSKQIIKLNAKIGEADNKMRATPVGSSEEALYKKAIDVYKNSLEEVEILKESIFKDEFKSNKINIKICPNLLYLKNETNITKPEKRNKAPAK